MKQILNNISRITLSIMREGRGVGLLLMTLVMMAMSPTNVWAETITISSNATYQYGYDVTSADIVIIESGVTITVNQEFTIRDENAKVINYGTINGNLSNDGVFVNYGTVNGDVSSYNGTFYNYGICGESSSTPNVCPHTTYENGKCTVCYYAQPPTLPFDLTITKAGASEATLSKEMVKTITINKSAAGAAQVKAQSGTEGVTPTQLEHNTRYNFTITAIPTLNPGEDDLEGDIVAKAKRRVAVPTTPPSEPTLTGPTLVIGTATAYTTYPLDAEHTDIKLQMLTNGSIIVNDSEIEGTVTSIYFVDAHVFTSETVSETYLKTAATCTTDAVYYHKCALCDASSENNTNSTWTKAGSATGNHNYVEDAENHRVTCGNTGCTFEAPMLTEGVNTHLTYAAVNNYNWNDPSGYPTMYYFKATGTGTLTIADSNADGSYDDCVGVIFNADKSTYQCAFGDNYNRRDFILTYNVTKDQVYWIGARAFSQNKEVTNHILTITGAWPHPVSSASITDGEAYDGSLAYKQAATFTYKRTYYNNDWNCLYVPFEAPVGDFTDCSIYAINMFQEHDTDGDGVLDALTLEVNKAPEGATIKANHPYLIKYTDALTAEEKTNGKVVSINMSDILLKPATTDGFSCSSMSTEYTFKGTYNAIDAATATSGTYYTIIVQNGKHVIGKTTSGLKPQRWYMTMSARDPQLETAVSNAAKRITIVDMDEEATGLRDLQFDNLQGTINGKYLESGKVVIVRNGKKYNVNGQVIK